ncbi:uncharacterized protein LOC129907280 [Episyrphus balteatus]|uniref:uncharacterized protein LOC129907280 n=1 Tax=Episyrphus balteatus TaxID=286459 RepID=UPI002485B88F|nr:uncharacterized protein LOC129907280 [Episyrphus balteatus]
MAECLLYIVEKVNLPVQPNIQISVKAQNSSIEDKFIETVEIFRRNYKEFIMDLLSDGNGGFDINFMIFFIDSVKSLEYLVQRNQQYKAEVLTIDGSAYYLIIFPKTLQSSTVFLKQIFDFCLKQSILNILLLQENEAGKIFLYTYYPFTENNCGNTLPEVQNIFSNGVFQLDKPLFEQKTKNLQSCPVKVIIIKHSEFINPMRPAIFDDILLKILAKNMNFSIQYKMSKGRGAVYSKDNMTNELKMLHDEDGDLIIGSWCAKTTNLFFGSVPYIFDNELIVFKKPEKYNYLDILFLPFDVTTWIMILISYILNLIMRLALRKNTSLRLFLITWFFGVMILSSSYGGCLFKFLHHRPRKTIPKNFEDAIDKGYKFAVSSKELYNELEDFQKYMIEVGENNMYAEFKRLKGKYSWLISDKYLNSYKDMGLKYLIAEKSLYTSLQCIYTRKNSYLTLHIRKEIELMNSNGLLTYIDRMYQTKTTNKDEENKHNIKPISLYHLKGVFNLYLKLIGISVFIFGMEHALSIKNVYFFRNKK